MDLIWILLRVEIRTLLLEREEARGTGISTLGGLTTSSFKETCFYNLKSKQIATSIMEMGCR